MELTDTQAPPPRSDVLQLADVSAADVVIGIPTYNHEECICQTLQAVQAGCAAYFTDAKCAIVHVDGGSSDRTVERAAELSSGAAPIVQMAYPLDRLDRLSGPYRGVPAKGSAVRAVFNAGRRLGAKVCAIADADVERFAPGWLDALIRPVLARDYDFVAPLYSRHKFAGAVNNGIAYPMIRALYGKRVRYPMGGDFACSMHFVDRRLAEEAWDGEMVKSSVDLWLTTRAIADGARICQASLGAKRDTWKDPGADASGALAQVLSALFQGAEQWASVWQKVRGSEPVTQFGTAELVEDTPVSVDVQRGIDSFRLGQKHLQEIWRLVLPPGTLLELHKLAALPESKFRLADTVWARIIFDFSQAYHQRTISREHLLAAFTPLFSGWVSSFVAETQEADAAEFEQRLEQLCLSFEGEKPYVISRWRWPDRFIP
jgi:glucosylglycerate synthase